MSTTNSTLFVDAIHDITRCMGIITLVAGLLGESFNCIVFLSLKTFRQNSCAFYLAGMSFVNLGQLLTGLLPYIMINGFSIDWTKTSSWYCKFRVYILQFCTLMSATCICLATIDQFFATCIHPRWQQLSNITLSRILFFIFLTIWILQGVPYLMYLNLIFLPPTNVSLCAITNGIFLNYFNLGFVVVFAGLLPVSITILFGLLAYRNVQQSNYQTVPVIRRELDKQLTVMVLVQVVFNCFAAIPYIIVYTISRSPYIVSNPFTYAQYTLAATVFIHMYFVQYATPFYIYMCVSERFRRQWIYVLFEMHLNRWRQHMLPNNQVTP